MIFIWHGSDGFETRPYTPRNFPNRSFLLALRMDADDAFSTILNGGRHGNVSQVRADPPLPLFKQLVLPIEERLEDFQSQYGRGGFEPGSEF